MRTYIQILLAALVAAFALNSCIIENSMVNTNYEPELVVEALFSPDSTWSLFIGHTDHNLNANFEDLKVENATVLLKNLTDFRPIPLHYDGDGYYKAIGFKPEEGLTYQLSVAAPGYTSIVADSYVPKLFSVDSSKVNVEYNTETKKYTVNVDFDIAPDLEKYFYWDVYFEDSELSSSLTLEENQSEQNVGPYNTDIPKFNPKNFNWVNQHEIIDGTVSVVIDNDSTGEHDPDSPSFAEKNLVVYIVATSSHLYDYYTNQNETEVNPSTLVSPNVDHSNIIDGAGIFGGYNEQFFRF